jgi:hypothetical protein
LPPSTEHGLLDPGQARALAGESMAQLNANIAAISTALLWWPGQSCAARWRD